MCAVDLAIAWEVKRSPQYYSILIQRCKDMRLNQCELRHSIGDLPLNPSFDYIFGEALHVVSPVARHLQAQGGRTHVDDGVGKAHRQNEPC